MLELEDNEDVLGAGLGEIVNQDREEYLARLRQWLDEARLWHALCEYYLNLQNQAVNNANVNQSNQDNNVHRNGPIYNNIPSQTVPVFPTIYEFVIPPLWKRVAAELVDFLILLFLKMIITFIIIETFYVISIENYKFDTFKQNLQDPKIAMQMSMEILTLEFLHRIIACCYEIYWLRGSPCATPGKRYMGLMVIKIDTVTAVPGHADEIVRVNNCAPLGFHKAILRSVVKNIFLGIMLPMFTLYIFRFNRTGYDAISNSLVVEYNPNFQFPPVH